MGRLVVGTIILITALTGCSRDIRWYVSNEPVVVPAQTVQHETVMRTAPLAAVLPHHDLVKAQRQALLATLAEQSQPETIIVVSPNHFGSGAGVMQTTDRIWSLAGGTAQLTPNSEVVYNLVESKLVTLEDSSFEGEHGIKNLLGDLHASFPSARIVPIILKDGVTAEQTTALTEQLMLNCTQCGLIASVDMSHYNPAAVAEVHDIKTMRALQQLDETDIWNVEVDSPASLGLLVHWAQAKQLEQFTLTDHTNSGRLLNDPYGETTTHIMGYYSTGSATPFPDQLTFTFAGDMMYGREIGYQFQTNQFRDLFTELGDRLFWGTDVSWANLEGPVSEQRVVQDRFAENLVFNFSTETISALKYLQLTTVGLANNHTANQGRSGLDTTRNLLTAAGVEAQGDPYEVTDQLSVKRYTQGKIKLATIAVHALIATDGLTEIIEAQQSAGYFVIVLPHWGTEYATQHSRQQEQLAQAWINAGADLIIGMHPHVVQDAQVLNSPEGNPKLVLYSLGNFIFDQTFSAETQQGLVVTGSLSAQELSLVPVPIISKQLKPQLAAEAERNVVIDRVCANLADYCQAGIITVPVTNE